MHMSNHLFFNVSSDCHTSVSRDEGLRGGRAT